jgi:soluble lytic murein transglycosylase
MRAEAMWRLAWRAYQDKDYAQAVKWLKRQIATKPIEDKYYAEGQPQYWLGRTYAKLGKSDESIAAYEDAVRKYPLTYYALLALNRLREQHPDRYTALLGEIHTAPAGYDPAQPEFQFQPRAIYGEPGFQRAIELLRLGIGWAAEWELATLGLTAPDGKQEVTDPDQREMLWAMAFLQHNAGRYEPSHWVTRWHVLDYKRAWPVGTNRARWVIGYPKAFWSMIEKYAAQHGYPMALQMSIVREESAFDPLRESWANAIGLTQMIYPTAVRFGKGTGIEINRDNLRDPEKNVIIGSNFLVFLWNKWDKHTALVPPSYNAGENAVARWLRDRGTLDVDEWAETIPGDQARNYSKRVLASYFVYSYLYGDDVPVMRNDIPKSIIPAARKKTSTPAKKKSKRQTNYKD